VKLPVVINVIVTKDGIVQDNDLFVTDQESGLVSSGHLAGKRVSDLAEKAFCECCRKYDPTLTDEELENYLDNGYYCKDMFVVCINWPTVRT
jgi:hypothetical protein